jgi:hypothetical protein
MMTRRSTTLAAVLVLGLAAGPAKAGLLPVTVTITPEAGNFRFTYAIVLPTDSQLRTGDYFTIYDFAGFVDGTNAQPDGWKFSSANVGPTPAFLAPDDSPLVPNLTWTYSGPMMDGTKAGLGNFWAVSLYGTTTDSMFTALTHRTSDGKFDSNITPTTVPVPAPPPPGVPEPATLALAGLGLPLLALARRRK